MYKSHYVHVTPLYVRLLHFAGWHLRQIWRLSENGVELCSRISTRKRQKSPSFRPTFSTLEKQRRWPSCVISYDISSMCQELDEGSCPVLTLETYILIKGHSIL